MGTPRGLVDVPGVNSKMRNTYTFTIIPYMNYSMSEYMTILIVIYSNTKSKGESLMRWGPWDKSLLGGGVPWSNLCRSTLM